MQSKATSQKCHQLLPAKRNFKSHHNNAAGDPNQLRKKKTKKNRFGSMRRAVCLFSM